MRSMRGLLPCLALGAAVVCAACSHPRPAPTVEADSAAEHVLRGITYQDQGRKDLARAEYEAAASQGFAPGFIGLTNLAVPEGRLDEAEVHLNSALAAAENEPGTEQFVAGVKNYLAMVYLVKGTNMDRAEQLALQALPHSGPLRPYVLDTLAHVFLNQSRYQDAWAALTEAEKTAPPHNESLQRLLAQSRRALVEASAQLY